MTRALIAVLVVSFCSAACGGSSPLVQGPSASNVAMQQSDLPSGMVRCDLTGDIDSFLNKEKTADPSTYQSTKTEWDDAKSKGASAAYTAFYTDSADHCAAINTKGADIGSATYRLVVNFVIQFKDDSSAAKGYTSGKLFNVSAAELCSSGQAVVEAPRRAFRPTRSCSTRRSATRLTTSRSGRRSRSWSSWPSSTSTRPPARKWRRERT